MKLMVFSDIHGDVAAVERLMAVEADIYVAAGDLVTWGRGLDLMGPALQRRAPRMWVLPGNHESALQVEDFCARFGLNPLHGRSLEAGGYHVGGLGYSSPTPFNTPGEYSESEMSEHLQIFEYLKPLILICHCPPKNTPLDEASPGAHFGSQAVWDFVRRAQPELFFCGHIHEAAGREVMIGPTRCVNAGKSGWVGEIGDPDGRPSHK